MEWMIRLVNMTFTAGCTVLFILVLRLLFRKLPKGYSYALWFIVLFRFLCPAALPSPLSLLPVHPEPMPQEIVYEQTPEIETGVIWVDRMVNQALEENLSAADWGTISVNPIQIVLFAFGVIWQAGMLVLFFYYLAGYWKLRRRLATAVQVEKGVYESDRITGAFVVGIFRPAVYLPSGLDEGSRSYILKHELVHIRRKDYLVKLLGLLVAMLHWFNPLAWVTFHFLCEDMEMSCDERVLKELGEGEKKPYSLALLQAAEKQSGLILPLAFGESHIRSRIKNVLNYKKPGFWIAALAILVLIVAGAGLMTNPVIQESVSIIGGADGPTSIFIAGKSEDGEPELDEMPDTAWLEATSFPAISFEETDGERLTLDFASEDMVIFHGDFGMFAFVREGNQWNLKLHAEEADFPDMEEFVKGIGDSANWQSQDSIHPEDKLKGEFPKEGWREAAANKMADGSIAVLGGYASGGSIRLIDLFYGYYHPELQVFHQVYLFGGDRQMQVISSGDIQAQRYLFSRDGYDYYLRTPERALDFEKEDGKEPESYHFPYGRLELVRCRGEQETVLDDLMCMQGDLEHNKVIVTEDRIVYTGAKAADLVSFEAPGLVSIAMDGSDRRVADIPYNVYSGLSYEGGYLYYQGWTDEGAFPRPLYRMTPDFENLEFLEDLNGSLMTVKEPEIIYVYNWEKGQVEVGGPHNNGVMYRFDRPGKDARHHQVETERLDGVMTITLKAVKEPYETEVYQLVIPVFARNRKHGSG